MPHHVQNNVFLWALILNYPFFSQYHTFSIRFGLDKFLNKNNPHSAAYINQHSYNCHKTRVTLMKEGPVTGLTHIFCLFNISLQNHPLWQLLWSPGTMLLMNKAFFMKYIQNTGSKSKSQEQITQCDCPSWVQAITSRQDQECTLSMLSSLDTKDTIKSFSSSISRAMTRKQSWDNDQLDLGPDPKSRLCQLCLPLAHVSVQVFCEI